MSCIDSVVSLLFLSCYMGGVYWQLGSERREENQLDAAEWFTALIICWNCATQSHNFPHPGHIAYCSAPNSRPPATKTLHTICGNETSIVWSSWWWAYKCPKHVGQIVSAIKHSVASIWFSSLRIYNDARTNIHQIGFYFYAISSSNNISEFDLIGHEKNIYVMCILSRSVFVRKYIDCRKVHGVSSEKLKQWLAG